MRHEDISTTMRYYAGANAEATADAVWNAWEGRDVGISVSIDPEAAENEQGSDAVSTEVDRVS